MPIIVGSTPTTLPSIISAKGVRPFSFTASSEAIIKTTSAVDHARSAGGSYHSVLFKSGS